MVIPRGAVVKGMLSIPRAELCAADALAKATMQIENDLDKQCNEHLPTICYDKKGQNMQAFSTSPMVENSNQVQSCRCRDEANFGRRFVKVQVANGTGVPETRRTHSTHEHGREGYVNTHSIPHQML